jgi:hypothetical protein
MNNTSNSSAMRRLRLLRPHANPLARGVDRLESVVLMLVVLVALLLLPIMLVLGSEVHAGLTEEGERQSETRRETVATLVADAPALITDGHGYAGGDKANVGATWKQPNGSTTTGTVKADKGMRAGAKVAIWLDNRTGQMVDRPIDPAGAAAGGVAGAAAGYLAVVGILALGQYSLHRTLDRRRLRGWGEQWTRVEPDWNNYRRT